MLDIFKNHLVISCVPFFKFQERGKAVQDIFVTQGYCLTDHACAINGEKAMSKRVGDIVADVATQVRGLKKPTEM